MGDVAFDRAEIVDMFLMARQMCLQSFFCFFQFFFSSWAQLVDMLHVVIDMCLQSLLLWEYVVTAGSSVRALA